MMHMSLSKFQNSNFASTYRKSKNKLKLSVKINTIHALIMKSIMYWCFFKSFEVLWCNVIKTIVLYRKVKSYHIEIMTGDVECSNETKCEINNFSNNTLTTMAFIKIWLMVIIFWDHFESSLRWYIFCNWSTWTVIILLLWCSYFNIIRLRILETTFWRSRCLRV